MPGLFDFFGNDQANLAMAAGLLGGGNFGQALARGLGAGQAMTTSQEENRLRQAHAQEYALRVEAAKREQAQAQQAQQRDAQFAQALQSGASPAELARYYPDKVDLLKKLAEAPNFGRQAVARTIDGTDAQGRPVTYQVDQYGQRVGEGIGQWKAPVQVNQGDRQTFVNPVDLKPMGSFGVNLSPAERDASARGWAGNAIAQERLAMDKAGGAEKAPSGYRYKADGNLEAIPGGPADSKLGAPGARMQDARDVLGILEQAEPLLKRSTGSYLGAGVDLGAQAFGLSTPGAKAAAELKALQGALISKMPKMTGPQSDKDVQLYREMAGQIGDATIPVETRAAAMRTVRALNEKYAGAQGGASGEWSGGTPAKPGRVPVASGLYGGRKVIKYSDGSTDYAD